MSDFITNGELRIEAERLADENVELRELVVDAVALLNRFCDSEDEHGCECPAWPDKSVWCELRDIEERMHGLGVGE